MKKLVSLLLILVLALGLTCPALAESNELVMETTLLEIFEYSVDEWTTNDDNRTIFATMAMLDAVLTDDQRVSDIAAQALVNNVIYVAREENLVSCFLFGETTCLMIVYMPGVGANAAFTELSDDLALGLMEALKADSGVIAYWKVEAEDVLTMMQGVLDAINQ